MQKDNLFLLINKKNKIYSGTIGLNCKFAPWLEIKNSITLKN